MIQPYLGGRVQPLDNSGNVSASIYVKFTEPGNPSTLKSVYSDYTLGTPLTNPVQMDAYGRKAIWIDGDYDAYTYNGDPDDPINPGALLYSDPNINPISTGLVFSSKSAAASVLFSSTSAGRKIFITSDDGGEFTVKYNATPGTYADDGGSYCGTQFIPSGGDGTIGIVRDYSGRANIKWFGAVGDGITNDSAAVQAAHDAFPNGKNIDVPPGKYRLESAITHTNSNIVFFGDGAGHQHDVSGDQYTSAFYWYGAAGGTMWTVNAIAGASNKRISGSGFQGIGLYGRGVAAYGVKVLSSYNGIFDAYYENFTTLSVYVGVVATLGEARDSQHNRFWIEAKQVGTTGSILELDGDSGANASYNIFFDVLGLYKNSTGIVFTNCDNNIFVNCWLFRFGGGAAVGMVFSGGTSRLQSARENVFIKCYPGAGGIIAKGYGTYAYPAKDNVIESYDDQGVAPTPIVEDGATLLIRNDTKNGIYGYSHKNITINGGCRIARRAVANISGTYQIGKTDRIACKADGTPSAGTITNTSSSSAGLSGYACRVSGLTTSGNAVVYWRTRIESKDAVALKNQIANVACKVQHGAGVSVDFTVTVNKANALNNFTAVTQISTSSAATPVADGTETDVLLTINDMGDCSNGIEIIIKGDVGAAVTTKTFDLTELEIKRGLSSIGFEYTPLEQEERRCARYWEKSYDDATAPGTATATGEVIAYAQNTSRLTYGFLGYQRKVQTPTITLYSPGTGASGKARDYTAAADVNVAATNIGDAGCEVLDSGAGWTAGNLMAYHWVADAEL